MFAEGACGCIACPLSSCAAVFQGPLESVHGMLTETGWTCTTSKTHGDGCACILTTECLSHKYTAKKH